MEAPRIHSQACPWLVGSGQTLTTVLILFCPTLAPLLATAWSYVWTLSKGLCVSGAIFVALLIIACFRLQSRIDEDHNSAPNLIARGTSYLITNVGADFYHLRIANDPVGILDRQTAQRLAGTVQICDAGGKPMVPARVHRWAASPQNIPLPQVADSQLPIDIEPNGMEHLFDVALKFEGDSAFFTHNNESVSKYGYRDPSYGFEPGIYIAVISIQGLNTRATFRCKIVNLGAAHKLDVQVME